MTIAEIDSARELMRRKSAVIRDIEVKRLQIEQLVQELRVVDREQDAWMASFGLRHSVDIDTARIEIDVKSGIVMT